MTLVNCEMDGAPMFLGPGTWAKSVGGKYRTDEGTSIFNFGHFESVGDEIDGNPVDEES